MTKITYIEALRLIATCAVVLMHTSSAFYASLPETTPLLAFHTYHYIGFFAVPIFVMISGALFLSPQRDTSYRNLLCKYVRRIALALLVFGLPMCMLESRFEHQTFIDACMNFLRGHNWTHMWYLYMIILLYLLTPVLKPFVLHQKRTTVEIGLGILFIISSLLPSMKNYGIEIESWIVLSTPFIFYYILGFYLATMEKIRIGKISLSIRSPLLHSASSLPYMSSALPYRKLSATTDSPYATLRNMTWWSVKKTIHKNALFNDRFS